MEVSKRKTQQVISSFFVLLYFCSLPAHAQYDGGTGEPNDPYLICTAEQMNEIGLHEEDWDKHFKLMADIDLRDFKGTEFNVIGKYWPFPFCGVFDGNYHEISYFSNASTDEDYIGLFGHLDDPNAQIINLGLVNPDIEAGTGAFVGSLVGRLKAGRIVGCYVEDGSVSGDFSVGGLVGVTLTGGTIINSYSNSNISGNDNVGGLIGGNIGTVDGCYSTCNVTGTTNVGGLVGVNGEFFMGWSLIMGTISNCYSVGSTSGNEDVGGLVGSYCVGIITNCYATGKVLGNKRVGGLVGTEVFGLGEVEACFWDIETSGQTTSAGGTGITTAEMQIASTFLETGWDFVEEVENGSDDVWWILEGQHYPRLWWQYGKTFSPYPQDGAVDVPQPLTLSWFPGGSGLYHDIYFGEDEETVTSATTESSEIYRGRQESEINIYGPGTLKLEKTYYWRIDEVNDADPNSLPKGNVWSFATSNFIVVDDFESYDAGDNQIWYTWHDGLGYGMFGAERYYSGNGTGSCVGEIDWIEETIVHNGQGSMLYYYDNNKKGFAQYSEAEKTLSYPRDWTEDGVSELSLWFRGQPADVGSFVEGPVGTYTISGSGTDIGDRSDQFHFAFKTLNGSGSITVRIDSIENTHELAKAGVMIREELYGYSKYAFVYVTPGNGIAFQGRLEWGTDFTTSQTGITTPHWIKLERDTANSFMAFHSSDGFEFQAIGEMQNIQMDTNVYIGFAITSHDSRIACEANFSNIMITGVVGAQWTNQDIGMTTNQIEPMYVFITNNTGEPAIVYHDDPDAAGINIWSEWVIPLEALAGQGLDLTDVNSIAIGFGDRNNPQPGGRGKMYFDDIRLYRPRLASLDALEVIVQ